MDAVPGLGFSCDADVARITLRRPPLNVLDLPLIRGLAGLLEELRERPGLRAIVIAAEGRAFCAGVSVPDHMPGQVEVMIPAFHGLFRTLHALAVPTIAVVQGAALGGGCELACFADVVIAAEDASFGVPEIKLACFPPIALVHFPARIGAARTLQLVLSGETLPAAEAARIGLVDRVVAADGLDAALAAELARLQSKSASALRLAKRAWLAAAHPDFEARLAAVESLFLNQLMATHDAVEGLQAFVEKRKPVWER